MSVDSVPNPDDDGSFEPSALIGADINVFLLRECARVSAGSANSQGTGRGAAFDTALSVLAGPHVAAAGCRRAAVGG